MDGDLLQQFAAVQRAQGLAANTIRNRHSIIRGLIRATGKQLPDITVTDLRLRLGRDGISAGTRRTERAAFAAVFAHLVEEGLRDDDPTLRLAKVRAPRGTPRPFTREQIDLMLRSGAYRRTRAMILLGYFQGFRVASIAATHGADVDFTSGTIRTVAKGSKALVFPLHPVVRTLAATMPADGWWFPARGGREGHVRPGSVTDAVRDAKVRAGITDPRLTAHSLRHSFGTDLVDAGVDIRVIAELMGHESVATTQIYTQVSADRRREGIHALEGVPLPQRSGRSQIAA
ncbi:tyrosine-type recombinase/integrase [Microcella alkaliphila]|uniref:Site-specific tyrosine recombinase XerD n=1 Tax=Microcella alkaliphila TaxID=279828 RepID=A0A0U5BNK9_9MICO|nr:tyrosine-type recombinase/integrase [Microcella alkaliphila]BAU32443.1 site-specific tyrosine recombinase XerD [Microcella alkaliphila]